MPPQAWVHYFCCCSIRGILYWMAIKNTKETSQDLCGGVPHHPHGLQQYWRLRIRRTIWQSFSDPAISSDSDSDWSTKFGLGLGLGLKKSWLSYTLTQNYQSMKCLWRFNYSRYLCMWFIKGIIGLEKRKNWNFGIFLWNADFFAV
jgi:hypothetical protein